MAETTTDDTHLTRAEAARYLRSIADELDGGRSRIHIPIGNKEVHLSPPDSLDLETTVHERSRSLRKDIEELSFTFTWNPTKDAAVAGDEAEPETEPETNP